MKIREKCWNGRYEQQQHSFTSPLLGAGQPLHKSFSLDFIQIAAKIMTKGPLGMSFEDLEDIASFSHLIVTPSGESRLKKERNKIAIYITYSNIHECDGYTCRVGLSFATTVSVLQKQRKKMKVHHSCGLILRPPNRQP